MHIISNTNIVKLTTLGISPMPHFFFLKIAFRIIASATMHIDILFIMSLTSEAVTIIVTGISIITPSISIGFIIFSPLPGTSVSNKYVNNGPYIII